MIVDRYWRSDPLHFKKSSVKPSVFLGEVYHHSVERRAASSCGISAQDVLEAEPVSDIPKLCVMGVILFCSV